MIRLKRIDPAKSREVLDYLQVTCLPGDEPCEYKPADQWVIAMDGDIPVAFGCVRPTPNDPGTWYLARAGVIGSARGKGLQKRLIRWRVSAAKAAGATLIVTDCTNDNAASANSLIRAGFRVYDPQTAWAMPTSIYWRLDLCPHSDSPAT